MKKYPWKKKDHLPYTNIVGKKRKKKSNGIDSVQPQKSMSTYLFRPITFVLWDWSLNNRFLRERGLASTPKIECQIFLCIFLKNSAMAILGFNEISFGKVGKKSALLAVLV